ncbi:hypothetical protein ABT218_31850 [Streptomyces sp. NPDC001455]
MDDNDSGSLLGRLAVLTDAAIAVLDAAEAEDRSPVDMDLTKEAKG